MAGKKNRGFALVEIMVALGILSVASVAITRLITQANKSSNNVIQKTDASFLVSEMISFLSDSDVCKLNFEGLNLGAVEVADAADLQDLADTLPVDNLFKIDGNGGNPVLTAIARYSKDFNFTGSKFYLEEMGLIKKYMRFSNNPVGAAEPLVHIKFYIKLKRYQGSQGSPSFYKFFTLTARLNQAGNIKECTASALSSDSYWKLTNNYEGLFYDGGVVGVGTALPGRNENLHVNSSLGTGSIALTSSAGVGPGNPISGLYLGNYNNSGTFTRTQGWGIEAFNNGSLYPSLRLKFQNSNTLETGVYDGTNTPYVDTPGNVYVHGGRNTYMIGLGEYQSMLEYARFIGVANNSVYGIGWCDPGVSGCNSLGTTHFGVAMPGGAGKIFNIYGTSDDFSAGLAASGNLYTNFRAASTGDLIGFGEYGKMLADGASWGINPNKIYGIGWCDATTCGIRQIGALIPGGDSFYIYGTTAIPAHLGASGGLYSAGADGSGVYFGIAGNQANLLAGPAKFAPTSIYGLYVNGSEISTYFPNPLVERFHVTGGLTTDGPTLLKKDLVVLETATLTKSVTAMEGITVTGDVKVNGDVEAVEVRATSDQRLKSEISILTGALAGLAQIKGIHFRWKSDQHPSIGVLAQDVQKIYPELVTQNEKGILSVNYMGLVGVLTEAIKEQQRKVDENSKMIKEIQEKLKIEGIH